MDIDDTSRKIIHYLQEKSETNLTHEDIAEKIEVSSSTVGNRIESLKEDGILEDYHPQINYEAAGVPHHLLFVCTVSIDKRRDVAEKAIDVDRVVDVRELLTGTHNVHVEVACLDTDSVERVTGNLYNLGLKIEYSDILRREHSQPFNHFGAEAFDNQESN